MDETSETSKLSGGCDVMVGGSPHVLRFLDLRQVLTQGSAREGREAMGPVRGAQGRNL